MGRDLTVTEQPAKACRGRRRRIGGPHPVDTHVGERIKLRRTLLGMSQSNVAEKLGITFQQFQKYERAGNRISASMLYQIAEALDIPVSFFFDGFTDDMPSPASAGMLANREAMQFMAFYSTLPDKIRSEVYHLVREASHRAGGKAEGMG